MKLIPRCVSLAMLLLCGQACVAPFSDYQSARLAGRGVVEVTPSYSYVDGAGDGESAKLQDNIGVQIATGMSDRVDLRVRVEHIRIDIDDPDFDFSATAFAIGPKFSLVRDRLALNLPVGFASGGEIEQGQTWQFHPTLIGTVRAAEFLEVSGSLKALIPLEGDNDFLAAFNIGLGVGPDLSRWAIRPEFGILKNPGDEGTVRHLGIGATFYFGRK